ncbi:DMT family transporter [Thalassotalea sp. ND16A]|uniref:DMT family transporter n=1 Tax=Thalassotalea sp. ND16A TaxID=1535422 RepID=UPI00051DD73F|nr:DMT family transporter [Thalassotalea sp. ND16A]KGJ98549.1 hypothetical protein ND16A_0619 [Thalassotalea sp. ND16A]
MIHTPLQALFALLLVNFIWGVGFVVIDDAINVMPVNTFNAFRFAIATLVLLPMYFISRKSTKDKAENSSLSLLKTGFGLGILLFLGFSLQAEGMLYTSVSNAGFITGMCVPLVPVLGFLTEKSVKKFG